MTDHTVQSTHWDTCWRDGGRKHYECAVARITELEDALRMAADEIHEDSQASKWHIMHFGNNEPFSEDCVVCVVGRALGWKDTPDD